ncbi:protein of unknown function [Candidatus Nitrospira inopinata]|uniref:Uncharacterized protein n=1 Tax=Candidatus Nitrospira inopinata TaxID=1715989 RepID=A0A0S4KTZ0_9BACT|nr:protein of unknown function [Candidatus Nitrospira inopinata]
MTRRCPFGCIPAIRPGGVIPDIHVVALTAVPFDFEAVVKRKYAEPLQAMSGSLDRVGR